MVNSQIEFQQDSDMQLAINTIIKDDIIDALNAFENEKLNLLQLVEVTTESMYPTIRKGQKVVVEEIASIAKFDIGDIIMFTNKDGIPVVHRIIGRVMVNGKIEYYTQGDNFETNPTFDADTVLESNIIGKIHMSERAVASALKRVQNGETTMLHALGETQITSKKISSPTIIKNAYDKANIEFKDKYGLILDMTYEAFEAAIISANKNGKWNGQAILKWRDSKCGRVFEDTMYKIEARDNPCLLCGKLASEDFTRFIADYIFAEMIKDGGNFEKGVALRRIFDEASLQKIGNILLDPCIHVDMYVTLTIDGKDYHLAIEHDGKQHDKDDPDGAFRAYLGMTRKTKQEIENILADEDSKIYQKYYHDWTRYMERDNAKDQLFANHESEGYYLIRVPAYIVNRNDIQQFIIGEFLLLTNNYIDVDWKDPNLLYQLKIN